MKTIVIYKSNTGFTKTYANWIAEELHCDSISLNNIEIENIKSFDLLIFGGGIHAGKINSLNKIKSILKQVSPTKAIIFATGATANIPEEINRFRKTNISNDENIEFFYFRSGLNYNKMQGKEKVIMSILRRVLTIKKNKNSVEKGTLEAIQSSYDYCTREAIKPLVDFVNNIQVIV